MCCIVYLPLEGLQALSVDNDLIRASFLQSSGRTNRDTGWWIYVYPDGDISTVRSMEYKIKQ